MLQDARISFSRTRKMMGVLGLALFGLATVAGAQVTVVGPTPVVGSSNPATAAPTVTRPTTTPCVVTLFENQEFANFAPKTFSYTPPAACPGPWAKVVFTADFTVTAGRQYDRTAAFYLGHANIYYGTTAEPRSTLSPSWHVERDVTDLSAMFKTAQTGQANLGNLYNSYYNGDIFATAKLEFYPANPANPAPAVPNVVVPINGGGGDAGALYKTSDTISQTMTFPTNVDRAYLDIIAQSQNQDEFWYSCAPDSVANELYNCGGGAFREAEVTIDGKAAGVAPVYPWIYTGGIDPFLWEPIPGIQTLDFVPYRVDLTPFAAELSDGSQHTVAVSVFGAHHYFLATANLLLYTDPGASQVTGGLLSDTLMAPSPQDEANVSMPASGKQMTAAVNTSMARSYTISGYVNTSQGRVDTTVNGSLNFVNNQKYTITNTEYVQDILQETNTDSTTTTKMGPYVSTKVEHFRYPLTLKFAEVVENDGSIDLITTVGQGFDKTESTSMNGSRAITSSIHENDQAADTLMFSSSFAFLGNKNSSATQSYEGRNSMGQCYSRTITATAQTLTSVTDGKGCGK